MQPPRRRRFFDDPNTPDTGSGWPPIVDMGAYEFGGTGPQPCLGGFWHGTCLLLGDLDHNGFVNISDLAQLLGNYGTTSGMTYEDGDLNGDGAVTLPDLAELLGQYGDACP